MTQDRAVAEKVGKDRGPHMSGTNAWKKKKCMPSRGCHRRGHRILRSVRSTAAGAATGCRGGRREARDRPQSFGPKHKKNSWYFLSPRISSPFNKETKADYDGGGIVNCTVAHGRQARC